MRLLFALQRGNTTIQTALDDLESFLWLLIWGIVHAVKDIDGAKAANQGIPAMLDAWSGGVDTNSNKLSIAQRRWRDAVFGDLIQKWLGLFEPADRDNEQIAKVMSTTTVGSQEWNDACNGLEIYCKKIYNEVLESGFRHLQEVKRYSKWDEVVAANSQRPNKKRRFE